MASCNDTQLSGRPAGHRVRQICQLLHDIGPSSRATIGENLTDIQARNIAKYCNRAVAMGLLHAEQEMGSKGLRFVYTVATNWRALADQRSARVMAIAVREATHAAALATTPKSRWSGINSIFQLGALQTP